MWTTTTMTSIILTTKNYNDTVSISIYRSICWLINLLSVDKLLETVVDPGLSELKLVIKRWPPPAAPYISCFFPPPHPETGGDGPLVSLPIRTCEKILFRLNVHVYDIPFAKIHRKSGLMPFKIKDWWQSRNLVDIIGFPRRVPLAFSTF